MQYFTIQAKTHREALERMKNEYGENSKILTYRNIRIGGFLGFFAKDGVELTGYVSTEEKNRPNLEDSKLKILEAAKKEQTLNYILREIKDLKANIPESSGGRNKKHETLEKISQLLVQNDFSDDFINRVIEKASSRFSLTDLDQFNNVSDAVIDWIAEEIPEAEKTVPGDKTRVMVLIGPTGVGKTTTVAKLAALYGIGNEKRPARKVRIITIDSYRIGAKKQIEIYGEIMRIPVSAAETKDDLKKLIALYSDADMILVDTIGKSQRDYKKLAEMNEILEGAGPGREVHLAISATTKTRDLEEIFQQFEPFGYKKVILTKLDETSQIGNIISVVAKKNKPISFITDGQKVPQDIEEYSLTRIMLQLEGFKINREYLDKKYAPKLRALA